MEADAKTGAVLSHVEAVYRPGDRDLAIALFEALGCKTYDTGTPSLSGQTYVSVHPDPSLRGLDDVIYLSEMTPQQSRFDDILRQRIDADAELSAARANFHELASAKPFGLSHIAIRYPDREMLERVLGGLEDRLSPEMKKRAVVRVFRPGDAEEITWESVQAFVFTDIAVTGCSAFGQVFELSAYGAFPDGEA